MKTPVTHLTRQAGMPANLMVSAMHSFAIYEEKWPYIEKE